MSLKNFRAEIKNRLDNEKKYRDRLFCRAYLLTESIPPCIDTFPFYSLWNITDLDRYIFISHPLLNVYTMQNSGTHILLAGHAYDPFSLADDENIIIDNLLTAYMRSYDDFLNELDRLTGVFVIFISSSDKLFFVQDAGGQRMAYFGKVDGKTVVTSSPQLVEDVYDIQRDEDVIKLTDSKGYYRGSGFLPGNLSAYKELKRLGPNTAIEYSNNEFVFQRIFPRKQRVELKNEYEKEVALTEMHSIFHNNLNLIIKKWKRVALSLTGGVDSKTTFANAKPWYEQLFVFSYISKDSEAVDAMAAKEICEKVGIAHHLYNIPEAESLINDYDFLNKIIEHNTSYTCKLHSNEIRKYIYLERMNDFDVEIKSDISEIGRAYTDRKYYKIKSPAVLTPRHLTIGQARYFFEPWCMKFADSAYLSFMSETGLTSDILGYTMHDLTYWEVRMGAWASTSFASQEYIHEITIPYNNRRLLDLFLAFPKEDRIHDLPHKMLMKKGNSEADLEENGVKDSYFAKKRMLAETLYYLYATLGYK